MLGQSIEKKQQKQNKGKIKISNLIVFNDSIAFMFYFSSDHLYLIKKFIFSLNYFPTAYPNLIAKSMKASSLFLGIKC